MSDIRETTLHIEGMTCGHCTRAVSQALRAVAGVTSVEVALADKRATVRHDAETAEAELVSAVKEEGYEARVT